MLKRTQVLLLAAVVFLAGAAAAWVLQSSIQRQPHATAGVPPRPAAQDGWLNGPAGEQLKAVERHLRGLDQTMVEIGYRFTELYWAGEDRNWPYARYQLDKIETTLKLGVERRPKRAASAAPFLAEEIPAMQRAIEREEETAFEDGITRFRTACMKCHAQEEVPWFVVDMPEQRLSPIRITR